MRKGIGLLRTFQYSGNPSDINGAVAMLQQAVNVASPGYPHLHILLSNLGNALTRRFERTGDISDLAESISVQKRALEVIPAGHGDLPGILINLGGSYARRFEMKGELSDVSGAISAQQRALRIIPQDHAHLPILLTELGATLLLRCAHTGELSDLGDAISVQQRAVDLTPHGHPDLPRQLNNLGASFTRRFEMTDNIFDVNSAISVGQRAVDVTPHGHSDLPGHLTTLGGSFARRFERTGELSDIADAISAQQRAVDSTPQDHANLPIRLNNLGSSYLRRFERTGELTDIDDAISAQNRAVRLIPQGHAHLPSLLSNLGNSLASRFERTGELSDISEAISAHQRAVRLTPQTHTGLLIYLTNLGTSFTTRFNATGELSDIADAISVQQRAVDLAQQDNTNLPTFLTNLGTSYTCRLKVTGELSDMENAIAMRRRALDLTPQGHASLPSVLINLGSAMHYRFTSNGDMGDLKEALTHFKSAALSTSGAPLIRLDAAQRWARTLIEHQPHSNEIILAFDTALSLVALIAGLEQTVRGRYTQLKSMSGLALEAAAAACDLDRPDKALEWLEQGRCLVWNQLNTLRTPFDDLRSHNKDLAESIADTAKQLENVGSSRVESHSGMLLSKKMSLDDEARGHLDLAEEWERLLKKAREIPGFESFLMPMPCSSLMQHLPDSGPIVVINIDGHRCDALALLDGVDEPLHIPLPNFSIEKASAYRTVLASLLQIHGLRVRASDPVTTIDSDTFGRGLKSAPIGKYGEDPPVYDALRGLWTEVVKPILSALGFSRVDQTAREEPPRLWWCPTGPLSFLPLHSAGIYRGPDAECVFDYVVSSYTPTVTAITDRVKHRHSIDTHASGLFLTSQPNAPRASPIPGTTKEVQWIFKRAEESGVRASKLDGDEMPVIVCLDRMKEFSSIHLACHGSQNAAEPLQSRFLFHQGHLELGTILKSNLKNADLAFLSACQTSTGQEALSNEAVHLAAGMLAAGYRRVVGTMWSIGDKPAQQVATTFYEYLFAHRDGTGGSGFDGTMSAYALHHATQQLRRSQDDSERSLLTWIPFVHFGY
ncbi:CHAT domain-containing protein [Ephemerocybe angulata]|uniref:CHAT domain-containing protein n=1 Tax=Ephemerocybe angulata TaxID=980116 RepID=A0A8H6IIY9_9AGAR|nr:CHAT domain-containing protein [Tulosesus angulatus]